MRHLHRKEDHNGIQFQNRFNFVLIICDRTQSSLTNATKHVCSARDKEVWKEVDLK